MTQFVHPAKEDITLPALLAALADPMRIRILQSLLKEQGCMSCCEASPCPDMPKSTLSHHFRILREAGLIRTTKKGVEHRNTLRLDDVNERFPGLLKTIFKFVDA
jgi:DNA-binding transcriptional ArsR family regulator